MVNINPETILEIPLGNINYNLRKTHTHTIIIKLNFDKGH